MQHISLYRFASHALAIWAVVSILSGCATPARLSVNQLASLGVTDGAVYWNAEQKLLQEGYICYVSGAKRENFECSKTKVSFQTCILRIRFEVNDQNAVSNLQVADPVCVGP